MIAVKLPSTVDKELAEKFLHQVSYKLGNLSLREVQSNEDKTWSQGQLCWALWYEPPIDPLHPDPNRSELNNIHTYWAMFYAGYDYAQHEAGR